MTSGRLSLSSRHCGSALFWRNEYNGHCREEIVWALDHVRGSNNGKPKAIVCNTVKGKGIVKRIGVQDWFGQSGPYDKLLEINGITKEDIVKTAEELLK